MYNYIGENPKISKSVSHNLNIVGFTGKRYKPGFEIVNGRKNFIDKVGQPDNRFMVFCSSVELKVYEDQKAIEKDWVKE